MVYQGQVWLYVSNLARALSSQSSFLNRTLYHIKGCEFDILSLNDAKGMAVLKAVEYFTRFLHQKGIYSDKELKKVDSAIEEFSVPLMEIYERQAWMYGFLDEWE